jgi:hypothetical protein
MLCRAAVPAVVLLAMQACTSTTVTGFDLDTGCSCVYFAPRIDAPVAVQMFRGDTMLLRAIASEDATGSWRLSNGIVAIEEDGKLRSSAGPTDRILIRALSLGSSVVTFVPAVEPTSSTVTLTIRDTADAAAIAFEPMGVLDTLRLRTGEPVDLRITLVDAAGLAIHGMPESVTIGDSLVLKRQRWAMPPVVGDWAFMGGRAGTTDVTATFRHLRRTLVVIVAG